MKLGRSLITLVLASTPAFAWAGGKAVIEAGSGKDKVQSSIEYDGGKLRVDAVGQTEGYMVMRDGKIYSVANAGGQPMVIDMAGMGKMLGGMAQKSVSTMDQDVATFVSLTDTGRSETVAGISGKVHVLTYVDTDGKQVSEEIVLSKDKRLRELSESLQLMSKAMAQAFDVKLEAGTQRLEKEIMGKGQGVLRFGSDFRLVSISDSTPDSGRFVLPAQPQQMPNLGDLLGSANSGGSVSASGSASTGGGNPLADIFGQKTDRQQDRVESRTNQEIDRATDEAVDSVLDKAFDKIFGR